MYPQERHDWIVEKLKLHKRIEVTDVVNSSNVTPETIRKDLAILENAGVLKGVHGGAIFVERLRFQANIDSCDQAESSEKKANARRAIEEIPDGGSIILDAGITTARIAPLIPDDLEFMVVTNSVPISLTLAL